MGWSAALEEERRTREEESTQLRDDTTTTATTSPWTIDALASLRRTYLERVTGHVPREDRERACGNRVFEFSPIYSSGRRAPW